MLNIQYEYILSDAKRAFQAIGYHSDWIRESYSFADLYRPNSPEQVIALSVFGQEPLDYRSACFGLEFENSNESAEIAVKRMRALGAPQLLYVKNGSTQRWQMRADHVSLTETIPTSQLSSFIKDHQQDWNPQIILRAKTGFLSSEPRQLDFIDLGLLPALEHEASKKIDQLVHRVCAMIEEFYQERKLEPDISDMFSLVFQLLVGKLLFDRHITTSPEIDFGSAGTVLEAVRNHYPSEDKAVLSGNELPEQILNKISQEIASSFSFANLSAETLTYVYENTFVSTSSRKQLGIHSTPSYLADYVLSQLPIEGILRQRFTYQACHMQAGQYYITLF